MGAAWRQKEAFTRIILGAAVDDVLGLLFLAVISSVITAPQTGGRPGLVPLGAIVGKAIVFLLGALVVGSFLSPRLFRPPGPRLLRPHGHAGGRALFREGVGPGSGDGLDRGGRPGGKLACALGLGMKLVSDGRPLVDAGTYAAVVFMIMMTTLATPSALAWAIRRGLGRGR